MRGPALILLIAGVSQAATPEDFLRSIRSGDVATLRKLASDRDEVNRADARGATPLHYAAVLGTPEAVKILIAAGADVNARNTFDATPLVLAAYSPEKVRLLLAAGADPKAKTKTGRSALIIAAGRAGTIAVVRSLLDAGCDVNEADTFGVSPLQLAAFEGQFETVRLLVSRGADVNAGDERGSTALQGAAGSLNADAVRFLLSKGADVNVSNYGSGKVRHGDVALTRLSALILAAPYGSVYLIRALLEAKADVNAQDGRGMTPLMAAVASENQDLNVVNALLKAGANVQAKDTDGATALDWARRVGNPLTVGLLESAGAKGGEISPVPVRKAPAVSAREAVELGLGLLAKSSAEFFNQTGCTGCHHQPAAAMAFRAARAVGVGDRGAIAQVVSRSATAARPVEPVLLQFINVGGEVDTAANLALAMADSGMPASSLTDALVHYIAGKQQADGSWKPTAISRPPSEDSRVSRAAAAVLAIRTYGWPARNAEWNERIARARQWMLKMEPRTNYERAELLLGLHRAGAKGAHLDRVARGLRGEQREDGGWSQNRHLPSDAYATGLALRALYETGGLKPADASYARGVAYLLKTQLEDGSWYVRSRSPKFQPYFESGFPHGHDQWISAAATAQAVAAIAPALQR